jgi:hypothetical protein
MSDGNDNTLNFSVDRDDSLMIAPAATAQRPQIEGAVPSLAADRLYQFAALTAGIFLLATML